MTAGETCIQVERLDEDRIAVVRLNRPSSLNALTLPMVAELRDVLAALDGDSDCRVIVLTGRGKGFCAGMDLHAAAQRHGGSGTGTVQKVANQELFAGMVRQLHQLRQPVIAAVNGPAAGAGLALALACDVRLANANARFLVGSVRIGLTAGESGVSYFLPRLIGAARAFELMLTGRTMGAEEALQAGLVCEVLPDVETLEPAAMRIARQIASNSPFSVKHTKQLMHKNVDANSLDSALELENHAQILATTTSDFREAVMAFNEKRPPTFTGT